MGTPAPVGARSGSAPKSTGSVTSRAGRIIHVSGSCKLDKELCRRMKIEPEQLQAKFKHAIDFGVEGSYNGRRAEEFEAAVRAHVAAATTRVILGTFRRSLRVVLHVDPDTGLAVMTDRQGVFVSGYRLSARQLANVLERGKL